MTRNNHYAESMDEQPTFSFPTILEGRGAVITILRNDVNYDILINGAFAAQMKFDEDTYTWYVASGEITDADLVIEIGERIERSFANMAIK
jgi:hypothetical protein